MKNWNCYLRETFAYTHYRKVVADTEEEAIIIMERLYDKGAFGATIEVRTRHDVETRAYLEMPRILEGEEE